MEENIFINNSNSIYNNGDRNTCNSSTNSSRSNTNNTNNSSGNINNSNNTTTVTLPTPVRSCYCSCILLLLLLLSSNINSSLLPEHPLQTLHTKQIPYLMTPFIKPFTNRDATPPVIIKIKGYMRRPNRAQEPPPPPH